MYDGHVLDIFDLGVEDFKSIQDFKPALHVQSNHKPILIFQGESFETSDKHKRLKNLLIDIFHQRDVKEANIVEVRRVMLFTCKGDE
jgi:ribosome production factor 2